MSSKTKLPYKREVSPLNVHKVNLYCKRCGRFVENCDSNAIEVLCWKCTCILTYDEAQLGENVQEKSGFVKGWAFMKEFVHKDGTVYNRGVEVPELKDKKIPTDIEKIKKERLDKRTKKKKTDKKEEVRKEKDLLKHAEAKKKAQKKDRIEKDKKMKKLKGK